MTDDDLDPMFALELELVDFARSFRQIGEAFLTAADAAGDLTGPERAGARRTDPRARMSARAADAAPTADDLAWEGDRRSLLDLDDSTRQLLDGAARYLADIWPIVDDGMPEPEDVDDLRTRLAVAETMLEHAAVALDLDEIDSERVGEQIGERLKHERAEGHKDALVPSRQNAQSKAKRLLIEGRVDVTRHDVDGEHAGLIVATCRGDSGTVYTLGYDPHRRQWRCTCEEMRGNCSHLAALKLITTVQPTEGGTT